MTIGVIVRYGDIETAVRTLKKKLTQEGFFADLKERQYYNKPSKKKKLKQAKVRKRRKKRAEKIGENFHKESNFEGTIIYSKEERFEKYRGEKCKRK